MSRLLRYSRSNMGASLAALIAASVASSARAQAPTATPPAPGEAYVAPAPLPTDQPATTPAPAPTTTAALPPPAVPAIPAIPPTAADANADAAAQAIDEQLVTEATNKASGDEYKLDLYGFTDFTYSYAVKNFSYGPPNDSFAVGNFNVYLASELGSNWRTLMEVRFTYLPNGNNVIDSTGNVTRTDTTVGDYTDLGRPTRWGGIIIERAYLEYSAHPLFNVRGGQWLTPYGIWNVDHGSPVIVGVRRPYIVGEEFLPQTQTGLDFYGTYDFPALQLGYHFTVSNGRGPIDTYQDLNTSKAIGGRLFGRADTPAGAFTLGLSGYHGRYTDKKQSYTIDPNGNLITLYPTTGDYNEQSIAADLKWEWNGFLLQSEAAMQDVVYDNLRPAALVFSGPPGYATDYRRTGIYGLTGYRFDLLGIMPWAGGEYYDAGTGPAQFKRAAAFWGGVNMRPIGRVTLKAQYTYSWSVSGKNLPPNSHYNNIDFQAAWSF